MTDQELDDLTAPSQYAPAAPVNLGGGFMLADLDEPVKRHRCWRCANPHTYGREDCPRNRGRDG